MYTTLDCPGTALIPGGYHGMGVTARLMPAYQGVGLWVTGLQQAGLAGSEVKGNASPQNGVIARLRGLGG